jgi:hypothetical protein
VKECVSVKFPSALNTDLQPVTLKLVLNWVDTLLLAEFMRTESPDFVQLDRREEDSEKVTVVFLCTPVHADLSDTTMRPKRGVFIRYPYKATFPIKKEKKVRCPK